MLTQNYIKELATRKQTTELNIRREYLQHLFLSYFYQQPKTESVFFKGGTALRILYGSPRFSIDLDFSSSLSREPLEQIIISVLDKIEKENITTSLKEAKTTSGGYLGIFEFIVYGQSITIQIEVSLREGGKSGEVTTIAGDLVPPYTVVRLEEEQLIREKAQALLTRQKPRDFYDMYFILRANLLSQAAKKLLPDVYKVLKRSRINFQKELKELLPKTHWLVIKDLKRNLEQEIEKLL